jgi:hypothetical protein
VLYLVVFFSIFLNNSFGLIFLRGKLFCMVDPMSLRRPGVSVRCACVAGVLRVCCACVARVLRECCACVAGVLRLWLRVCCGSVEQLRVLMYW